ncbi:hypothetical protein ACFQ2B_29915 [Streptomyces stramineus]
MTAAPAVRAPGVWRRTSPSAASVVSTPQPRPNRPYGSEARGDSGSGGSAGASLPVRRISWAATPSTPARVVSSSRTRSAVGGWTARRAAPPAAVGSSVSSSSRSRPRTSSTVAAPR